MHIVIPDAAYSAKKTTKVASQKRELKFLQRLEQVVVNLARHDKNKVCGCATYDMLSADDDEDAVGSAVRCANKVAGAKAEAEASTRANAVNENLMAKQSTECANVSECAT